MIESLYPCFQKWSANGKVWIISDTHFDDADCKYMDPDWPQPYIHVRTIKRYMHKHDTLICLGDVGNPVYFDSMMAYKVLITGNHDRGASHYQRHFNEVFTGPLFVGERILLSHEPIYGLNWCVNIHGHDHNGEHRPDDFHVNLCSNIVNYLPFDLSRAIRDGMISKQYGLHRHTIDAVRKESDKVCWKEDLWETM